MVQQKQVHLEHLQAVVVVVLYKVAVHLVIGFALMLNVVTAIMHGE